MVVIVQEQSDLPLCNYTWQFDLGCSCNCFFGGSCLKELVNKEGIKDSLKLKIVIDTGDPNIMAEVMKSYFGG